MKITNIFVSYLKMVRAVQIFSIIFKHGTKELWAHSFLGQYARKRKIRRCQPVYSTQERLRITIEDLGPTYIKFGQILADRPDVVSERFRTELKKLQSSAEPFSDAVALRIIENELRAKVEDIFEEFDHNCLASASIGQVYKARLHTGEDVIVKVRRPNIDQKIKLDLYLMRYLAANLAQNYPEMAAINVVGVVDDFGQSIVAELDYFNESGNMLRFADMFADSDTVHIPKVYMEYTTKRVLVMERIYGITPDNNEKLRDAGLDPEVIAVNGTNALLRMIMRDGFFHADPHAGNMFIMPGNVIGLIDFGMVGVLRTRDMEFLANISMGFFRKDETEIADALIKLCNIRYFERRDDLIFSLQQMLTQYTHVPLEQLDYGKMMQQSINVITKYGLQIPSGIFMLIKSLATIQKVSQELSPSIPFAELIAPFAKDILHEKFSPRRMATQLYETFTSYYNLIQALPGDIGEIVYKIKQGEIKHDIHFTDSRDIERVARSVSYRLAYAVILVGLFIGSIALLGIRDDVNFARFMVWLSSGLIFIFIFRWIFRNTNTK